MKRVLIVNNNLHIGGVQKALVNLLACIHDRYAVTLALFNPEGELLKDIPEDVTILPISSAYRFLGMTKADVQGKPMLKLQRSFFAAVCRLFGRDAAIRLMAVSQKKLTGYDVAISYLHDAADKLFYGGCNDFVLRHVDASSKITFLHCDYTKCGADTQKNAARYAQFDSIAACSEGCRKAFVETLPKLRDKTKTVCNCQDFEHIRLAAAEAPVTLQKDRINIVTVARFGKEKGVARAIEALGKLKTERPLHYYVIGDGRERPVIESLIQRFQLEEKITLVGEMRNPYGYMAAADLLLIPSVSEAAPMVIGEAACLGTPILSTQTSSAVDMIEQTGFGWVCENNVDGITQMLEELLNDKERILSKKRFLQNVKLDNENAVIRFERMIGK